MMQELVIGMGVMCLMIVVVILLWAASKKSSGEIHYYDEGLGEGEEDEKPTLKREACSRIWSILYGQPYPFGDLPDEDVKDRYDGLFLSLRLNTGDMEKVREAVVEAIKSNTSQFPQVDEMIINEICS